MSKRKSSPGVCDVCGCAVVRMNEPHLETGVVDGHEYLDGVLLSVRCAQHNKAGSPEADARGGAPKVRTFGVVD